MKRFLIAAAFFLCGAARAVAPGDFIANQINVDGFTTTPKVIAQPPSSGDGLFFFPGATKVAYFVTLDPSSFSVSSGVLSVIPGAASWSSLSGKPAWTSVFDGSFASLTSVPATLSGYGITDAYPLSGNPSGFLTSSALLPYLTSSTAASTYATQSSLTSGLAAKFNTPAGTTAQYVRGDGSLATLPSPGTGTVTSVVAGTGLSGGNITTSGTISMPNTGTAGTYSSVTTDAQGRVSAGANWSINDAPGRALVTSTSATGYQISSTRNSRGCYEGSISTTSTIGGPSAATVFIETAATNSTTPSDWTIRAQQTYSNNITLAIVLNQVQGNNWSMCRDFGAAAFVRIRYATTGTASASINSTQQEVTF